MYKLIFTSIIGMLFASNSRAQDSTRIEKKAIYFGVSAGTWFPDGQNKVLGNPLLFGFTADIRTEKNAFGLTFDLIGWPDHHTREPLKIKHGNDILIRNDFFGAHLTLDYGREIWSRNRFLLEGICGIGYGRLTYYNPDKDTEIGKSSLVINPGICIRYLAGRKLCIQWKTQYCIANYHLNDHVSTDLRGNYLTTKLIFGSR